MGVGFVGGGFDEGVGVGCGGDEGLLGGEECGGGCWLGG